MEANKVDMYMMSNTNFFEGHNLQSIREQLLALDDDKWPMIQMVQFKNPTTALLISIFAGMYGIDRFYIGDTGKGVGKLLTCGGVGIWTIVDWFLIQGATKQKNLEKFNQAMMS
jgi:TM2 domain-containing membrane protein YozV